MVFFSSDLKRKKIIMQNWWPIAHIVIYSGDYSNYSGVMVNIFTGIGKQFDDQNSRRDFLHPRRKKLHIYKIKPNKMV